MQFYEGKIIFEDCAENFFELNEKIADEKILPIIFSASCEKFEILITTNILERLEKSQVEKIFARFCAVKNIFLREITPSRARKISLRAERENFISSYQAHVQNYLQGHENFSLDYFDNPAFKVEEILIDSAPLSFESAIKNFAMDKTFVDELKRIYSPNHPKKFFGHPVHYKISAKNFHAAKEIAAQLCRALYTNERIVGGCLNFIRDVKKDFGAEVDVENIFRQFAGAAVVIDSDEEFFIELAKKFCKETLFIFIEPAKNFIEKIVEIKEGTASRAEAQEFLKKLLKDANLNYGEEEISDALGEKIIFSLSDIYEIFEKLRAENLSRNIYVEYKNIEVEKNFDAEKILQSMVGLTEIKSLFGKIIDNFKIQKLRAEFGVKNFPQGMHMIFIGNPGTAKTTVAKLLAKILSRKIIECSRADLVGKYIGWTAPAVEKKFQEARGGILFIDEAYSLLDDTSFGAEAINEIVRQLEICRDDTIVIFAGYPDGMKNFLEQNEGFSSRISFVINFPDYDADELIEILKFMTRQKNLKISAEVVAKCKKIFAEVYRKKNFGNGRFVRNLLERAILNQSRRILSSEEKISREELLELKAEDFDEKIFVQFEDTKIGFAK